MVAGSFVALMYHNLASVSAGRYSMSIDDFRGQLSWLRAEGFTIDGFRELRQRLTSDVFPERYTVVTFDDGHKSNVIAANILREFDAQATFFLTKQACQTNSSFMDDHEILEVSRLCSVGSHGVTHRPLSRMNPGQIEYELGDSKHWLEDIVGCRIESFSAPGGFLDSRVVRQGLEMGYSLIGNSVEWRNHASSLSRRRVVNRAEVAGSFSLEKYARLVDGNVSYLLRRRLRSSLLTIPRHLLMSYRLRKNKPA